ncbi:unnamed protein product, partial [Staurois parvus]
HRCLYQHQWHPEAGVGGCALHLPHGVTPDPLHEKVSCKASRRSPQDGSDLRIEHNGSDSDPLCSPICRSNPSCGDRRLALQFTFSWSGSGVTPYRLHADDPRRMNGICGL